MAKFYSQEYVPELNEHRVCQLLLHRADLRCLAEFLDPEDTLTQLMDLEREMARILDAYNRLPAKKRERIETYLFGNMTQAQQAKFFGTSQPNVKRDFMRALDHLIRLMKPSKKGGKPQEPYEPKP